MTSTSPNRSAERVVVAAGILVPVHTAAQSATAKLCPKAQLWPNSKKTATRALLLSLPNLLIH